MAIHVPASAAKGAFIDNKWQPTASARSLPVIAPGDGLVFAAIAAGGPQDIDAAVRSARRAYDQGPWGRMPAVERGRLLMRLAVLVADNGDELSRLEARDTGKPMKQAKADMVAVARYFEYYGTAADKLHGDTIPFLSGYFVATTWEPLGVTGHIIPWNYPGQMFARSVAPSLAVGNAAVIKPAEEACLVPLRLAELAAEAGFPEGVVNVVPGLGEEAGAALSAHPGIDFISFTGSPEVGSLIQTAAARNHIGCTLELGGKSPHVVFADADYDAVVAAVTNAIIQNAGQTCSAGSRVLVERAAWDRVVEGLASRFQQLRVGSPDMDLDVGPVISGAQKARIEGFLARAEKNGGSRLAQGKIVEGLPTGGFYVPPAMYQPEARGSEIAREEVFGPILAALPFDNEADAVALANDTEYGLIAGVWSNDGSRALRVARGIRAGQVYVNAFGAGGGIELPFGGTKKSGHGREKGFEALYEMAALKTIVIKHN
jgi:aldehyde dehydrogenase (NAD+)